jgi:hypothetical protein
MKEKTIMFNLLGVAPIDLTGTASTLVTYVGEAAVAGATVFAAIYGVRILVKGFRAIAK